MRNTCTIMFITCPSISSLTSLDFKNFQNVNELSFHQLPFKPSIE